MHDAKLFLAGLLHVSIDDLEKALTATYEKKRIPKRKGGTRTLLVPMEPLKFVQRRILKCLLCRFELPPYFHGFRRLGSTVSNAAPHRNGWHTHYCLKVDLKDAFLNVKEVHFRELIARLMDALPSYRIWRKARIIKFGDPSGNKTGISFPALAHLLRQISKKHPVFKERYKAWLDGREGGWQQLLLFEEYLPKAKFEEFLRDTFELLLAFTFHKGSLPQGAPSSPYLLNLSLWFSGLTGRLHRVTRVIEATQSMPRDCTQSFRWTIYADDITFSSARSFNSRPFAAQGDQRTAKGIILSEIEGHGWYRINSKKIHDFNSRKEHPLITGLRVVKEKVGLPKKQIRWLRSFLHHAKQNPDPKVKAQIKGWASYVRMVYNVGEEFGAYRSIPRQIRELSKY